MKSLWILMAAGVGMIGCSTLPSPTVVRYPYPKKFAFTGEPDRPYRTLGVVRTKVSWPTLLSPDVEEKDLCTNYYNKGVIDLVKRARANGGSGIADLKSVTFLVDGRQELHPTAECSDDGEEGQILLQAVAVKWVSALDPAAVIPGSKPKEAPTADVKLPVEPYQKPSKPSEFPALSPYPTGAFPEGARVPTDEELGN